MHCGNCSLTVLPLPTPISDVDSQHLYRSEDPLGLADTSDDSATDRVTPRMASLEVEKRDAQHTR